MIDLTTADPALTRYAVADVFTDVFDRVTDAHARGDAPPTLDATGELVRACQERDDVVALDEALQKVAHSAIAQIARLRAVCPDLGGAS